MAKRAKREPVEGVRDGDRFYRHPIEKHAISPRRVNRTIR
jgi:hypothetical protein